MRNHHVQVVEDSGIQVVRCLGGVALRERRSEAETHASKGRVVHTKRVRPERTSREAPSKGPAEINMLIKGESSESSMRRIRELSSDPS